MTPNTPEKASSGSQSLDRVAQPGKLHTNTEAFSAILDDIDRISERSGEDHSGDWSGSGSGTAVATSAQSQGIAIRDLAMANLPTPTLMQKQLQKHIKAEIKQLRRQTKRIARIGRPGAAYKLNLLYARIHSLNAMMSQLVHASYEVLKRLFIRVFIDRQPIL